MPMSRIFQKYYIGLALLLGVCVFVIAGLTASAIAQNNALGEEEELYDPSDYEQWKRLYKAPPPPDNLARQGKKACATQMFADRMIVESYKRGGNIDDMPLSADYLEEMEKKYQALREDGVAKFQENMMRQYNKCVEETPPLEDPSKEYDVHLRQSGCARLGKFLMSVVEGIKNQQSLRSVLRKNGKRQIEFPEEPTGMPSKDNIDLSVVMATNLYRSAEAIKDPKERYEKSLDKALQMVMSCGM
ncbi:MAG: hypothetical protein ACLFU1_01585 [Alphaproteobacteria bacterium]